MRFHTLIFGLVCSISVTAWAAPATTRAVTSTAPTTRPVVTVERAVELFAKDPAATVTVEFTVERVGWLGWYPKDQRPSQIRLTAKGTVNGAKFCVDVTESEGASLPSADENNKGAADGADLQRPLIELKGRKMRATGVLRHWIAADHPEGGVDLYIIRVNGEAGTTVAVVK